MNQKPNMNQKKARNKQAEMILWVVIAVLILALVSTALAVLLYEPNVSATPPFDTDETTTAAGGEDVGVSAEPYVRKEDYYTFLIAGVDDVSLSTDVMMLVSLDAKTGAVKVVQLPRDTFVNAKVGGFTTVHRVNAVFTGEYNRLVNSGITAKTAKPLAMQALLDRLSETLCVRIDEYVLMNTSGFRGIIDALGGVYYDVPVDMQYEDPEQELYIDLKAGYQHLDGEKCEQLIRYRSGYGRGDIERMEMRADFMKEMFRQVKEHIDLASMLRLIRDKDLLQKTNTSMSLMDLIAYVKMAYAVDTERIEVRTLGGEVLQDPESGYWLYYCLNKKEALRDINECLNVYTRDITMNQFDKAGFFTDPETEKNQYIHEYYLSDVN